VLLVVAATERELTPVDGARSLACGIGPVEAAVATARALAEERPAAVLHVGIAGARGLDPLALVLGTEAVYCDAAGPLVPALALPDPALLDRVHAALPEALLRPIGTSARVGGSHTVDVVLGSLVFVPAAFFFPWFALLSVAWLALVGLVVPVVMIEQRPPGAALRRAVELCRADTIHALGSLATLVIVFVLTRIALAFLLREQADNTIRAAVFIADLVVSPLLFLGAALLYFDQEARTRKEKP
jgi:hypothetical protein